MEIEPTQAELEAQVDHLFEAADMAAFLIWNQIAELAISSSVDTSQYYQSEQADQ